MLMLKDTLCTLRGIIKLMKKGTGATLNINARTEQTIRFAGFILPVVLTLYGLLVQLGLLSNTHVIDLSLFLLLSLVWIILGVYQYLFPIMIKLRAAIQLVMYHALAVLYILFVSGLNMPFTACVIVLFLASYAYFGRNGLKLSVLVFLATIPVDMLLHVNNTSYMIQSALFAIGAGVVGVIAGAIIASQEIDRNVLAKSQSDATLQRDRILTIVNNLSDAVMSIDKDGIIRVYNAACLGLLDTNKDLNGQHISTVLHLTDGSNKPFRLVTNLRSARSVVSREDLSMAISGEVIRLSVVYSPIRGDDSNSNLQTHKDGFVIILRDITKQKSLEEERDEFISVVSHELRTPITIAEGSLSNLEFMMDRADIPKKTVVDNIKVSHGQVMYLARMVNDLSTLSRAERGVADATEEINVDELIQGLYKEYAPEAEQKGLRLDLDVDIKLGTVNASRLYLKELLQNFITNSIKYTKTGDVTIIVKKTEGDTIRFAVKDTGIGMSKSDQSHIFEKFWRSEDYRTRETGGTGLGLYVVRKLATKLGVEIKLTSRLNHGSTFEFSMPSAKQSK